MTAAWLGPDEFLVITDVDRSRRPPTGWPAPSPDSAASEVSDRLTVIRLSGSRARWVLAKGCALDLHPRIFGPGDCAQTLFERAGITLLQRDAAPTYHLLVRRSFGLSGPGWSTPARVGVHFDQAS